jgi:predicted Zn-dependent protease
VAELSLAPGAGVPPAATRAAHKNLGVCLLRLGEPRAAIGYLQSATKLSNGEDTELAQLLATAQSSPGEQIDRQVDASGLADSERPMWEAFEGGAAAPPATRVLSR